MDRQDQLDPFRQGYAAYLDCKSNPHPPDSHEANEWQRGWDTAQADFAW